MQKNKLKFRPASRAIALEPRLLFDGAGAVAVVDAQADQPAEPPPAPAAEAPAPAPEAAPEPAAAAESPASTGSGDGGASADADADDNAASPAATAQGTCDDESGGDGSDEGASAADEDDATGVVSADGEADTDLGADSAADTDASTDATDEEATASAAADEAGDDTDTDTDPAAIDALEEQTATLVVVDARVAEQEGFTLDVPANVTVRVVQSDESGLDAVGNELASHPGRQYGTIHIISHGTPGSLSLGNELIAGGSLTEAQRDKLLGWALYLTDEADILLYGCDIAAGSEGEAFITELAHLTGADIAASTDATGAAELGGNWVLEVSTGAIEATALTVAGFNGLLAALPTVAITDLPAAGDLLIGESFEFGLAFTNPGDDGYGPYIDLFLPRGPMVTTASPSMASPIWAARSTIRSSRSTAAARPHIPMLVTPPISP